MFSHGAVERMENQIQPQQSPKGTTFLRTCFNELNALSGVGILSTPYALSLGGWIGLVILFVVAVMCCYTELCMDSDTRIKTYSDIRELAFGPGEGYNIQFDVSSTIQLYSVAVEFFILEGDNLNKSYPNTSFKIISRKFGGKHCFVLLTTLVIPPTTWLRSVGSLAYVSAGGVLASLVLIVSVFWAS